MTSPKGLGGQLAAQPLHFIWMLDCSGSMALDGKIESLNTAIAEALPQLRDEARRNPTVQLLMRVVTFSNGARWHVSTPIPVQDFRWEDVRVSAPDAPTELGSALRLIAQEMETPPMPAHAHRPHLLLVSDGMPTDDWRAGLETLMGTPWGRKAMRLAIAIGRDASLSALQKFIGNPEIRPLQANNPEALAALIRVVSSSAVSAVSRVGGASPLAIVGDDAAAAMRGATIW